MINPKKTKLLVTTGLTETWGESDEKLIFLGDWCRPLASKILINIRDYKTAQYIQIRRHVHRRIHTKYSDQLTRF